MNKAKRDAYFATLKVPLEEVYKRDHCICHLCKSYVPWDEASRDHVRPRSQGGKTTFRNIKLAHKYCNSKRGSKPVSDFKNLTKLKIDVTLT